MSNEVTDKTQDVVEEWVRLTGCANACGFDSLEAAIEHLADSHLASLSASPDKPRERLARKVGVAIANRANLGDEPPVGASASPEQNTSCSGEMTLAFEQAGWLAVAQIAEDRGDHAVAEEARQNAKRLTALRNRDDVLEEAAKVAEREYKLTITSQSSYGSGRSAAAEEIAQAIRNLKSGGHNDRG